MDYLLVIVLVAFSALFSGLTLGFFSLNRDDLQRKADLGDKKAKKILVVRKNGNLLLCTLLIGNVAVNSALSIFLGSIASGVIAGLVATALIVVFGEIIPQAAFSRYALELGGRLVWLVRLFMFILYPICWPIAWMLDKALGEEMATVYSKKELIKLIEEHEDMDESDVDEDEEKIIKGALSFSNKTARQIMTPRSEIFALEANEKFNKKLIQKIYKAGHSRIPIYKEKLDNIIGVLFVKDLISEDLKSKNAKDIIDKELIFVDHGKKLDDLLNAFRKHKMHMAVVLDEYNGVIGLVTIEDVIEEIIGAEIMDEFDKYEDLQKLARQKAAKKKINKA